MLITLLATKEIYLAGGCFWGVQEVYREGKGIVFTTVGYANSNVENPTYQYVRTYTTNAVEAVRVVYDETQITVAKLLDVFFSIINPFTPYGQGEDIGSNYRPGVYYLHDSERETIEQEFRVQQAKFDQPIQVELLKLVNFFEAEPYHQNYLRDNPNGYCHIDMSAYKMK